ncbi:NADP-dependent oxidoreductase [soil metagenome]
MQRHARSFLLLLSLTAFCGTVARAQPDTMKAVRFHAYGGAELLKIEDVPRPTPAAGELLVRVIAAGVNPVDAKVRQGTFKQPGATLPLIPGYDISGIVEAAGAKATKFKKGDSVYAYLSLTRGGAYAEYAIVPEKDAAPKPKNLTHAEAAAVPLAALTAWQALVEKAKLESGQAALIHGGSGGVGSFAVQIAKARGAKVVATASTRNQEFLRELGVDQPINYRATKFEEVVSDIDVVLDTVGSDTLTRSYDIVKKGGIIVSIVDQPAKEELEKRSIRGAVFLVQPNGEQLAAIGQLIEAGQVKSSLTHTFPMAEVGRAHEAIASGHTRGKLVLRIAEEPAP